MKRGVGLLIGLFLSAAPAVSNADDTAGSLSGVASGQTAGVAKNIGLEEFEKIRTENKSVVIDLRTPAEYAVGHIPGAVNIDSSNRNFAETVAALDRGHTYLVHGAGLSKSTNALERIAKLKFTNVYNLEGGIKVWREAGKPLEKFPADANNPSAQ